jgi:hypothetical protein
MAAAGKIHSACPATPLHVEERPQCERHLLPGAIPSGVAGTTEKSELSFLWRVAAAIASGETSPAKSLNRGVSQDGA